MTCKIHSDIEEVYPCSLCVLEDESFCFTKADDDLTLYEICRNTGHKEYDGTKFCYCGQKRY